MKPIFLIGYMGTGKTTYGRMLAKDFNMIFLDLDDYIESNQGKSIVQIFDSEGEDGFRKIENESLLEVSQLTDVIIATGGGTPCFFNNMDVMNRVGVTIFLNSSVPLLCENLKEGLTKRPLLAGKTPEELRSFITEGLNKRMTFYEKSKVIVNEPTYDKLFEIFKKIQRNSI
ncbi:MAG: shikimate kinase [Paludibacteraceae bacterium]|nr:shikimate kinase [Paludibacteraceae bacterium]